tara:strand:- start:65 stop:475 length:411 start_codon:yes stop_codon:yes gene_type:complete
MDNDIKMILNKIGLYFNETDTLIGMIISRDIFLNKALYKEIYSEIPMIKNYLKSSSCTCLHSNAENNQKWPLLNITRQILRTYGFKMTPKRQSDGYSDDGKKKYKRFYIIEKNKEKNKECDISNNTQYDNDIDDNI